MLMDTTNGKYILSKTKVSVYLLIAISSLLFVCFSTFAQSPEIRRENVLCVAGCYRRDIATSKSRRIRVMCVKALTGKISCVFTRFRASGRSLAYININMYPKASGTVVQIYIPVYSVHPCPLVEIGISVRS